MGDSFHELYLEALDEEIYDVGLYLSDGRCNSFDEYKHKTGIIKGLELAKRIVHDELTKTVQLQNIDD